MISIQSSLYNGFGYKRIQTYLTQTRWLPLPGVPSCPLHNGQLRGTGRAPDKLVGLCLLLGRQRRKSEDANMLPTRKPDPLRAADVDVDHVPPVRTARGRLLAQRPGPVLRSVDVSRRGIAETEGTHRSRHALRDDPDRAIWDGKRHTARVVRRVFSCRVGDTLIGRRNVELNLRVEACRRQKAHDNDDEQESKRVVPEHAAPSRHRSSSCHRSD